MATPTYDILSTITLSSDTNSVTFNNIGSIAAGYTDLIVEIDCSSIEYGSQTRLIVNNQTSGFIYNIKSMWGTGSTSSTFRASNVNEILIGNGVANRVGQRTTYSLQFFDVFSTNFHKPCLIRADSDYYGTESSVVRLNYLPAITTLNFRETGLGKFIAGSVFRLIGVVS